MKTDSDLHLDETQIIQAVVDVADLSAAVREHLAENGGELAPDACIQCHDPHSPF